jgi:hypothetical protein
MPRKCHGLALNDFTKSANQGAVEVLREFLVIFIIGCHKAEQPVFTGFFQHVQRAGLDEIIFAVSFLGIFITFLELFQPEMI